MPVLAILHGGQSESPGSQNMNHLTLRWGASIMIPKPARDGCRRRDSAARVPVLGKAAWNGRPSHGGTGPAARLQKRLALFRAQPGTRDYAREGRPPQPSQDRPFLN